MHLFTIPDMAGAHLGGWRHHGGLLAQQGAGRLHGLHPDDAGRAARLADLMVPELQRRGVFRKDYAGITLREHMGLPPAHIGFSRSARRRNSREEQAV
ncbi:MAG: nitrilotriacetate monooxygenase [Belnapia sp.]|nr:nitrilotriacetate monooxygenase [Belnapia sp.]